MLFQFKACIKFHSDIFLFCRHLDISCAPDILTMNLTLTGELGYVMLVQVWSLPQMFLKLFTVEMSSSLAEVEWDLAPLLLQVMNLWWKIVGVTLPGFIERVRPSRLRCHHGSWGPPGYQALRLLRHARPPDRKVLRILGAGPRQSDHALRVRKVFQGQVRAQKQRQQKTRLYRQKGHGATEEGRKLIIFTHFVNLELNLLLEMQCFTAKKMLAQTRLGRLCDPFIVMCIWAPNGRTSEQRWVRLNSAQIQKPVLPRFFIKSSQTWSKKSK